MFTTGFFKLRGRRHTQGYTNPRTEATLRAALAEPAAPGEDESYRRLMTVIADDLRLRQPVQHRNWSWLPVTSVALAGMILAVIAYDAGIGRGKDLAARLPAASTPAATPSPYNSMVPIGSYVPPSDRAVKPVKPHVNVREVHPAPAGSEQIVLAWVPTEMLSKDQLEFVRIVGEKKDAGDWEGAARTLVQMADAEPASPVAINAVYEAARIQLDQLSKKDEALSLFKRAEQMCDDQLAKTDDPARYRQFNDWRGLAQLGIRQSSETPNADSTEPATP